MIAASRLAAGAASLTRNETLTWTVLTDAMLEEIQDGSPMFAHGSGTAKRARCSKRTPQT